MKGKRLLAGGAVTLAALFTAAALYHPGEIKFSGKLNEVGSISNELKLIELKNDAGQTMRFDVSSLGLVANGNITLDKNEVYRAVSNESLLQRAWHAVIPGGGDFADYDHSANWFGLCPMVTSCGATKAPAQQRDGMDHSHMDMGQPDTTATQPKTLQPPPAPEHHHH